MKKIAKNNNKILENKYINIDQEDINKVLEALQANQLAGTADIVKTYEGVLAKYFGVTNALAVSSGTAAEHLLFYMLDLKEGDEVIVPPTAPIMSALPIIAMRATPVFVDVNRKDFGFNTDDLKRKITSKTKAIITVPMWGYPTNTKEVYEIAKDNGILFIEDASHCHGSIIENEMVGTHSDVSFFSTQERKLIATGEGGFILTNNDLIADQVREIRDFGKPVRSTPELKDKIGKYGYLFGLNFRLSAMSAALGITQTNKVDTKINKRTENAKYLREKLSQYNWIKEIKVKENATPNYYSIVMFIDHGRHSAHEIAKALYNDGIVSDTYRFGITPLYELPIFSAYKSECPNSEKILTEIITLPTHEGLEKSDLDYIVNALSIFK